MFLAIGETLLDVAYLFCLFFLGITMLRECGRRRLYRLCGAMAIFLGAGDLFGHVPGLFALWTAGTELPSLLSGAAGFSSSVGLTCFYLLLYYMWRERYYVKTRAHFTIILGLLAALHLLLGGALAFLPQSLLPGSYPPSFWELAGRLPLFAMGIFIACLFYRRSHQNNDWSFRWLWCAVALAFLFDISAVLLAEYHPLFGLLSYPKFACYVWIISMGYRDMHKRMF